MDAEIAAEEPDNAKEPVSEPKIEEAPEENPKSDDALPEDTVADEAAPDAPEDPPEEPKTPEIEPEFTPTPEPTPATEQRGTFVPLVMGGLVAGLIGYGAAWLQSSDTPAATPADIADLQAQIASIPAPTDVSDLTSAIAAIETSAAEQSARIDAALTALDQRIETVEKQPSGDGTLQEAAIAAYERDLQALRDQITAQQADLEAVAAQAADQLEATRATALKVQENIVETARNETALASLANLQVALENGAPLGGLLADLEEAMGTAPPAALIAVSEGVPTLDSLESEFPDVARAVLATARSEGVSGEETSGFGAFLRNQLDIRSVAPKEGTSTDAILSRAEDALKRGRLNDALAEIAALPEVARAGMSDWLANAEARAAAVDAAATLATTLNDN